MYNLQYSGIITSILPKTGNKLSLDGLLISTETNPYYEYFDPFFIFHVYALYPSDENSKMRFLYLDEYTYALPTQIAILKNTMYRALREADKSYNYFIYRFLKNTLDTL